MTDLFSCKIYLKQKEISTLSCRRQGEYISFSAFCPYFRDGIYRLYITNGGERSATMLVGVLAPENGRLAIRKKISIAELSRSGIDLSEEIRAALGVTGFEGSKQDNGLPDDMPRTDDSGSWLADTPEWLNLSDPNDLLKDEALISALSEAPEVLYRLEGKNTVEICVPFDSNNPVGIAPAFSVSRIFGRRGKTYACVMISNGYIQKRTK